VRAEPGRNSRPKCESSEGVFGEGQLGSGKRCKLPNGIWGRAPTADFFQCSKNPENAYSGHKCRLVPMAVLGKNILAPHYLGRNNG